jgi:hypothetical protein
MTINTFIMWCGRRGGLAFVSCASVFTVATMLALPCQASEIAQVGGTYNYWPTKWTPIAGINDAKDGGAGQLDFVGDSAFPGGYWASDANYIYLRTRVAWGSAVTTGTYSDTVVVLIDKLGYGADDGRPDYGFAWDSKSNNNNNHGLEMQILSTKGNTWKTTSMDDIDGSSGLKTTRDINGVNGTERVGEGYVRTIDFQDTGASHFGLTAFVDMAVSWDYLLQPGKGNTVLGKMQNWNIAFASIANATDHNALTNDIAGGASPSDPLTLGWSATIMVPEPSTLSLLAAGGGVLLLRRRRK